jgi:hypothetical protein
MKKIFTTAILSSIALFSFGQGSLALLDTNDVNVTGTIIAIPIATNASHTQEILVTNTSLTSKTYKVRRTIFTMDATDATQFCWGGLCYGYSTNLSSLTLTVAPGDTVDFVGNGFHAIFNSGPNAVTRFVHYQFFDNANTNDSSGVTLQYNGFVGVNELAKAEGNISSAFPNPATAMVSIKYDMNQYAQNARLELFNMLGKKVKAIELTDKQGVAKIDVSEMTPGVYFYTFVINDKAIATKKLVISEK